MVFKIKFLLFFIIISLFFLTFYVALYNSSLSTDENLDYENQFVLDVNLSKDLDYNVFFCSQDYNCQTSILNIVKDSNNVLCSIYDLSYKPFLDALVSRKKELNDSNIDFNSFFFLDLKNTSSKNSLIGDLKYNNINTSTNLNQQQIMHNKFCMFNNNLFLLGSTNFTDRGFNYNNNNFIIFDNKVINNSISNLFKNKRSSINNIDTNNIDTNKNISNVNQINLSNYINHTYNFHYEDLFYKFYFIKPYNTNNLKLKEDLISLLSNSNNNINCMFFTFTNLDLYDALLSANKDNSSKVKIILEKRNISKYSVYNNYASDFNSVNNSFQIILDKNKYNMHNKFCTIDNNILITGSLNFTQNSFSNNYESIFITNNKEMVDLYNNYFEKYWTLWNSSS